MLSRLTQDSFSYHLPLLYRLVFSRFFYFGGNLGNVKKSDYFSQLHYFITGVLFFLEYLKQTAFRNIIIVITIISKYSMRGK